MQRRGFSNIYQQILARKLASGFWAAGSRSKLGKEPDYPVCFPSPSTLISRQYLKADNNNFHVLSKLPSI
jgi:hypothetical protein